MTSNRTKRLLALLGILFGVIVLATAYLGFLLTRDVDFDWENPNPVDADFARKRIQRYESAYKNNQQGWVRLSQLQINSYLRSVLTNAPSDDQRYHLQRLGVGMNNTNMTLYSWGETHVALVPIKFVVQRGFQFRHRDTNVLNAPLKSLKIGEVEIPHRLWRRVAPIVHDLDAPLSTNFTWMTNIQAALMVKNPLSQQTELRLYTYSPIPPEDLR